MSKKRWVPHPTRAYHVDYHALRWHKHSMTMEEGNKFMSTPNEDGSRKTKFDYHQHLHDTGQFGLGEPHEHFTPKDKK